MTRILEDDAKRLLATFGITVPHGVRVSNGEQAREVAAKLGDCVVKALVPAGRRGKAGLVQTCATPDQAFVTAQAMLGATHAGYPVEHLLIEERIDIERELYVALRFSASAPRYELLASAAGGVEIEDHEAAVRVLEIDPARGLDSDAVSSLWYSIASETANALTRLTELLFDAYVRLDATLLEINPLAMTASGDIVAVGAMLAVDDNALARQPEAAAVAVQGSDRAVRPETELEARVSEINADRSQRGSARYLELEDGDIGFLCGGGGASLLLFDALVAAGGTPANYTEFGGNPTEQRVYDLTRVVLAKPGVRGLFVAHNITNNTQVDVVARGVTRALADAELPDRFPVVAREVGVNDEEGARIFEAAGVRYLGEDVTLDQAAVEMVARMRERWS